MRATNCGERLGVLVQLKIGPRGAPLDFGDDFHIGEAVCPKALGKSQPKTDQPGLRVNLQQETVVVFDELDSDSIFIDKIPQLVFALPRK